MSDKLIKVFIYFCGIAIFLCIVAYIFMLMFFNGGLKFPAVIFNDFFDGRLISHEARSLSPFATYYLHPSGVLFSGLFYGAFLYMILLLWGAKICGRTWKIKAGIVFLFILSFVFTFYQSYEDIRMEDLNQQMYAAASDGKTNVVKSLIGEAGDIDNALIYAAEEGRTDVVKELIAAGAKTDYLGIEGRTALMEALFRGHINTARTLLEMGADPEDRDRWGNTVLPYAGDSVPVAKLLIEAKANLNKKNRDGKTAYDLAVARGQRVLAQILIDAGAAGGKHDAERSEEQIVRIVRWEGFDRRGGSNEMEITGKGYTKISEGGPPRSFSVLLYSESPKLLDDCLQFFDYNRPPVSEPHVEIKGRGSFWGNQLVLRDVSSCEGTIAGEAEGPKGSE